MNGRVLVVIRYLYFAVARDRNIWRPWIWATACAWFAAILTVNAQFKVVGPAPVPPTVARQQIRTSLEKVEPSNTKQTIQTLSGLLAWYRDILDEELIGAWRKDSRANLPEVMEALADSRVATAIVAFSWREQRQAAFNLDSAPMLGHLMVRFPESAQPFLDDLLGPIGRGQQLPDLSEPEAEAVCRILLDMPDVGAWRQNARQILPHYRQAAETLLAQDLKESDREKRFRAQVWSNDLQIGTPDAANQPPPRPRRRAVSPDYPVTDRPVPRNPTASAAAPRAEPEPAPVPAQTNTVPAVAPLPPVPAPSAPLYAGAKSGTLESTGGPIPQNAEYVFRNLPGVKLQLDYDTKTWDARLLPCEGQTQRLILKNKSSGPQKRCVVHWSAIP